MKSLILIAFVITLSFPTFGQSLDMRHVIKQENIELPEVVHGDLNLSGILPG